MNVNLFDGGNAGNGGGGNGGNSNPPAQNTPPEGMEFLKGVDEALLNEPSVKNIKDLNSLVKSFVHSQKMIGADKVVIPKEGATAEQWNEVFTKLGLPSKDKYILSKPEKSFLGDQFYAQAQELGHSLGILPHQMQGFIAKLEETSGIAQKAMMDNQQKAIQDQITGLKNEWGEAFDAKIFNAKQVLNKFGSQEDKDFIANSGLGANPQFIKLMEKIGSSMKEAKIIEGKESYGTPQDNKEKLDSIMRDRNHPYWNRSHVDHAKSVQEVEELNKKIYS